MQPREYLQGLRPGGDQYIIIPDLTERKTKGGVVLADQNKEEMKEQAGEIVAVGPGRQFDNQWGRQGMEFAAGDRVLFKKFAGDDYYLDEDLKRYPQHEEMREGLTPVKVLRQDSILHTL